MNYLLASEIKRRGVTAIEDALKNGPVHIIKDNRLVCVALNEKEYITLVHSLQSSAIDLWEILDNRPWKGNRSRNDILLQIKNERKSWDKC